MANDRNPVVLSGVHGAYAGDKTHIDWRHPSPEPEGAAQETADAAPDDQPAAQPPAPQPPSSESTFERWKRRFGFV